MIKRDFSRKLVSAAMLWTLAVLPLAATAQTRISMPKNKYKVEDDVKLGRKVAAEVEQQFPILNDSFAQRYIEDVGERLVAAIPPQFQQPGFDYRFQVVNASDINAFALPGGPMYVNRGMIEAAKNEGEMAGVMAHEISHVALRHATAQATKQSSVGNQLGVLGMILGGAILGGETGAQLGQLGAAAWQTKYSRDYETQADILGAQIMANAGYDPRDLANMFQTIARQGGGRGPEWLSSHPDPGNRFQKINQEAAALRVSPNPIKVTSEFARVKERFRGMGRANTMAEIERGSRGGNGRTQSPTGGGRYSNGVEAPSARTRVYTDGNFIRMNVPSNWQEFSGQDSIQFAPSGAYGDQGITHGAMIGRSRANGNLGDATQDLVQTLLQNNDYLRQRTGFSQTTVAGRSGYTTILSGRSPVTGQNETVRIYTAQLRNGDLFYIAAVAPDSESYSYNTAFRNMINSIRLND